MKKIEILKKRLQEIEEKISEIEKRLPAHSVKPPIMTELITLEDERDEILLLIKTARENP